jgi:hypothetical protein
MAKGPIKNLPIVKAFAEYFIRKAKKDLGITRAFYKTATVEYSTRGIVYVWFFPPDSGTTPIHITYNADGTKL